MELNEEYKIERTTDGFNVCLYKKKTVKTGPRTDEIEWVHQGRYWGTFENAFRGAIKVIGIDKITYRDGVEAVMGELAQCMSMIERIAEDVRRMDLESAFCKNCPVKKKVEKKDAEKTEL